MAASPPVLGCTCGECTDGWLSPRMRYRLMSMSATIMIEYDYLTLVCR